MNANNVGNQPSGNVTVLIKRPLRLSVDLRDESMAKFNVRLATTDLVQEDRKAFILELIQSVKNKVFDIMPKVAEIGIFKIFTVFKNLLNVDVRNADTTLSENELSFIRQALTFKDPKAFQVIEQSHLEGEQAPLYGIFERHIHGKDILVRYEEDIDLREERIVPKGTSLEDFFNQEIKPKADDAWLEVIA